MFRGGLFHAAPRLLLAIHGFGSGVLPHRKTPSRESLEKVSLKGNPNCCTGSPLKGPRTCKMRLSEKPLVCGHLSKIMQTWLLLSTIFAAFRSHVLCYSHLIHLTKMQQPQPSASWDGKTFPRTMPQGDSRLNDS